MFKRKNIAFVLRNICLEYDDRVRKESIALSKVANVTIYVNFSDSYSSNSVTNLEVQKDEKC
jgi:hypothetical protein